MLMNTTTILTYGSRVRLETVDPYGFCGRDQHPAEADVGFLGVVVGNHVMYQDEDGDDVCRENVLGGVEYAYTDEDWVAVCYKVRAADGRELELMNHEIEVI